MCRASHTRCLVHLYLCIQYCKTPVKCTAVAVYGTADSPTDYAHALDYVKQVDAAKGDRLFMCLHKRYTQDVIAAAGGVTNVQLQEAYRYLSLVDAAVNL